MDGGEETGATSESGDGDGDPTGDGDGDGEAAFAEIRCTKVNELDVCYGLPVGSEDAWVVVVADCVLNDLVATGDASDVAGWTDETCAPGQHPANFMPEWRCLFREQAQASACFSGDGQWWTQVRPQCDAPAGPVAPWPASICGEASAVGTNPWSATGCLTDPITSCTGEYADDSFRIWPTCWVDMLPPAPVPECLGDGQACVDGDLGCRCMPGDACLPGLICAVADNGNEVCSLPNTTSTEPCDHGLPLELSGVLHDSACVAGCTQNVDDCGDLECSPIDASNKGFCAWPTGYAPGEAWGPCPIDKQSGQPTLCYGEDLACVPADFGESNICLPLGSCPADAPTWGTMHEVGWGDACYLRCETDDDCGDGMVCGMAIADGQPMCAWPREESCAGTLGCNCLPGGECAENLTCSDGWCTSCPAGQIGCPCANGQCDLGLVCADGFCEVQP